MPASSEKVLQLRQLLAERFGATAFSAESMAVTGLKALDDIGVPRGAITEIVSTSAGGAGGSLLLYGLLHALAQNGERVAVIDGKNSFQPRGLPAEDLPRLLWLRCHDVREAMKAADLAARDGNLPFLILLLTLNPASELRRIPSSNWHRLQMLAEKSAASLLIFTPAPQVGCARLRVSVGGAFPLAKLHGVRAELLPELRLNIERGRGGERRDGDEDLCRAACA